MTGGAGASATVQACRPPRTEGCRPDLGSPTAPIRSGEPAERGGSSSSDSPAADPAAPRPKEPSADHPPRWGGRFRRLEHRRDEDYSSLDVAVCGAAIVSVAEWLRLLRCAVCFPAVPS
ncbi:hypothetical protein UA75_06560 [Actinoalloteichus sp. GBA129-24]|uniref:Uncharacterized protein n=1 Tax=Actinoalloteichus fjordicus TaxID=1612552 RepID=A0AAC9PQS6_9PSEU|nr:hypothetical protein UA74_06560 [Actinoalloteichus fjordicus]APU19335.1 hypothetical protein UA75_06560 [Actinoalloteichus sp. GBA129-24]